MQLSIFHWLVAVVAVEVVVAVLVVGPSRFAGGLAPIIGRHRESVPYVVVLGVTAAFGSVVRRTAADVSWLVGLNVTPFIESIEGGAAGWIQSFATPPATAALAFAYVFGFPLLLVFPVVLYAVLDDPRPFRELALAYAITDLVGLVAFTALISYGPRNAIPGIVDPILFSTYPSTRILNAAATANTNVFPSLHTSLSVTVAYMAWRTRGTVGRWWYLSAPLAACIVLATMYLGIHWIVDVVAGALLGVGSVRVAARAVDRGLLQRAVWAIRWRGR